MYDSLGESTQILTHALYHHYSAPPGLDWDTRGSDDPFVNDKTLSTFNADEKCDNLKDWLREMSTHYRTNHLMITMGDDFNYQNARMNFESTDALLDWWATYYEE